MLETDVALTCRICESPTTLTFCDLGMSPLANSYLADESEVPSEKRYPLHARVCSNCLLVQLPAIETPEHIFSDYAYFSSYSTSWLEHSKAYVGQMSDRLSLASDSLVVEVASNDGYLLQYFVERGVPVLGVEPAVNVAQVARGRGVRTEVAFFGEKTARDLSSRYGLADLALGNNVIAHVPDLHDFIEGFRAILKPHGIVTFEFPHLLQLVKYGQFDTIYHEHFSYLSLHALERALKTHGLKCVDVQELSTHGGSLRLFATHEDNRMPEGPAVEETRRKERDGGLLDLKTYADFQHIAEERRQEMRQFFRECRRRKTRLVAYGAPAKGNTLLNFCEATRQDVAYTVDRNPAKQNHLLPGSHIPIYAPDKIFADKPDIVLILPWNLEDEIVREMGGIRQWGGKFAVAIPSLKVF